MRDDRHARHRRADADRRRRPVDGHRVRGRGRFERIVVDALAALPPALLAHLDGVVLAIEDDARRRATGAGRGPARPVRPASRGSDPSRRPGAPRPGPAHAVPPSARGTRAVPSRPHGARSRGRRRPGGRRPPRPRRRPSSTTSAGLTRPSATSTPRGTRLSGGEQGARTPGQSPRCPRSGVPAPGSGAVRSTSSRAPSRARPALRPDPAGRAGRSGSMPSSVPSRCAVPGAGVAGRLRGVVHHDDGAPVVATR